MATQVVALPQVIPRLFKVLCKADFTFELEMLDKGSNKKDESGHIPVCEIVHESEGIPPPLLEP